MQRQVDRLLPFCRKITINPHLVIVSRNTEGREEIDKKFQRYSLAAFVENDLRVLGQKEYSPKEYVDAVKKHINGTMEIFFLVERYEALMDVISAAIYAIINQNIDQELRGQSTRVIAYENLIEEIQESIKQKLIE